MSTSTTATTLVPPCNKEQLEDNDDTSNSVVDEEQGREQSEDGEEGNNIEGPTLSKNQLKRLKRKEHWQQVKHQKRKVEKDRYKARKRECRERGEDPGPTRKQLKHNTMAKSNCKVKVAIDCHFDDFMMEKDIKMLVKQIQFSYSANRRAENPLQFYCCGISGKTSERLESLGDYKGWDINFRSEDYLDLFDKPSVVYLSSESPNVLQTLDDDKVYVIGGLVDHNHHKGLCHRLAEEKGITHAQLPISEYIDMKTRKVLTINHVFEILLHYTETKDWQKAFYTVLPPRKGAVLKTASGDNSNKTDTSDTSKDDKHSGEDNSEKDKRNEEKHTGENNSKKDTKYEDKNSEDNSKNMCDLRLTKEDNSECDLTSVQESTKSSERNTDANKTDDGNINKEEGVS